MDTTPVPQRSLTSLRAPTDPDSPRGRLARVIARRPRVTPWLAIVLSLGFATTATAVITMDRWLGAIGIGDVVAGEPSPVTVRVPPFAGVTTADGRLGPGGILLERGQLVTPADVATVEAVAASRPSGGTYALAMFGLMAALAAMCSHHMRRSTRGRLVRVQVFSLLAVLVVALVTKVVLVTSTLSILVVPVALLSMIPTLAIDRIVGLTTGILGALVISLLGPFDVGVTIVLLVQAAVAGVVVTEQMRSRWRSIAITGVVTAVLTCATTLALTYLSTGGAAPVDAPLHASWLAAGLGAVLAGALALPALPLYQLAVGEITHGRLIQLEDRANPLLRQIAERAPGTWQHSLMMASMAEDAANAIGANARLVRVGAYYHDLGKSLHPKFFIENLEPGETSPHDQLAPEASCDAIFAHVTEGILSARKAGLHERIVDFMHMHHGSSVLEYFWGRCKDQGNPRGLSMEQFRYPGHPPQTRETAILTIVDAVEAASRTLKRPDVAAIDALVQRIVDGKLHLGQLDECGLTMQDLRLLGESLRDTLRHANHGRIEYPWQKAKPQEDTAASSSPDVSTTTPAPRVDVRAAETTADIRGGVPSAAGPDAPVTARSAAQAAARAPERSTFAIGDTQPAFPDKLAAPEEPEASRGVRRRPTTSPPAPRAGPADPRSATAPGPAPDGVITAATLGEPSSARKRAATLPPIATARAPSLGAASRRPSTSPPTARIAGPPKPTDLENAVTNPPPIHRPQLVIVPDPSPDAHAETTMPAMPAATDDLESRSTSRMSAATADDASVTSPAMRKVADEPAPRSRVSTERGRRDLPLKPPAEPAEASAPEPVQTAGRSRMSELAARIDAQLGDDEWSPETPVIAPTSAELRSLLGSPDPTRQVPLAEIEASALRSRDVDSEDPELFQRRVPPQPTAEVDPDDIEAAIEVAPPARRAPSSVAVAKSTKPRGDE